jgi:hypothetical protein
VSEVLDGDHGVADSVVQVVDRVLVDEGDASQVRVQTLESSVSRGWCRERRTHGRLVPEVLVVVEDLLVGLGDVASLVGVVVGEAQAGVALDDVAGEPGGGLVAAVDALDSFVLPALDAGGVVLFALGDLHVEGPHGGGVDREMVLVVDGHVDEDHLGVGPRRAKLIVFGSVHHQHPETVT